MIEIKRLDKFTEGGYGQVYRGTDPTGGTVAIKSIPMTRWGLPCLMEASILSSFDHPAILRALYVVPDDYYLNLVLPMAECDLKHLRGRHQLIDSKTIKRYIFEVAEAILVLHSNRIIHGDLKASNVLCFNNELKVTDFSLGRFFGNYSGLVGTATHRAPESWLFQEWNQQIDVWAFGCTAYEIMYGQGSPFPAEEDPAKAVNTIKSFLNSISAQQRPLEKISYQKPILDPRFLTNTELNTLIKECFHWDPVKRPSFSDIISNRIFREYPRRHGSVVSTPLIHLKEESSIKKQIRVLDPDESLVDLAYQIYNRSLRLLSKGIKSERLIDGSVYIASKLLKKSVKDLNGNDEIAIAEELQFMLHCSGSSIEIKTINKSPTLSNKSSTRSRKSLKNH